MKSALSFSLAVLLFSSFAVGCSSDSGEEYPSIKKMLGNKSTQKPSPELPFDMPLEAETGKSKKKVFAHYFSPFPISLDNKSPESDHYATGYLAPDGEKNKHIKYGGYLRQRPLPRSPLGDKWEMEDMKTEVKRAVAIGLDGFAYDILGTSGVHWKRLEILLDAAKEVNPDFKIMLMPDMEAVFKGKPEALVPAIKKLANHPSVYKLDDGRLVLSAFNAQKQTPEWWGKAFAELKESGIEIAFVPVFQAYWKYTDDYAKVSYGFSDWGCGTNEEEITDKRKKAPQTIHTMGKLWMSPIRPQDFRPKSQMCWESANSNLFRNMWDTAISGDAEWVQLITWNDYGEGTEIAPSTGTRYSFYDLTAYYSAWFKTGRAPEIKRDALYYFHRTQPLSLKGTKQESPIKLTGAPSDEIELLAFLKEKGLLKIQINGKTYTKEAPAGMTSFKVPLEAGTPVFILERDGKTVTELKSSFSIKNEADYQNLLYYGDGSLRK